MFYRSAGLRDAPPYYWARSYKNISEYGVQLYLFIYNGAKKPLRPSFCHPVAADADELESNRAEVKTNRVEVKSNRAETDYLCAIKIFLLAIKIGLLALGFVFLAFIFDSLAFIFDFGAFRLIADG